MAQEILRTFDMTELPGTDLVPGDAVVGLSHGAGFNELEETIVTNFLYADEGRVAGSPLPDNHFNSTLGREIRPPGFNGTLTDGYALAVPLDSREQYTPYTPRIRGSAFQKAVRLVVVASLTSSCGGDLGTATRDIIYVLRDPQSSSYKHIGAVTRIMPGKQPETSDTKGLIGTRSASALRAKGLLQQGVRRPLLTGLPGTNKRR